jgi:hypothetical protein
VPFITPVAPYPISGHPQLLDDPVGRRVGRIGVLVRMRFEHDPTQQRPDPAQRKRQRES